MFAKSLRERRCAEDERIKLRGNIFNEALDNIVTCTQSTYLKSKGSIAKQ